MSARPTVAALRAALVLAALLAAPLAAAHAGAYAQGMNAWLAGDRAAALAAFRRAAAAGDVRAEVWLGEAYAKGRGVARDPARALRWLHRAAARGNAQAKYDLGRMYRDGIGVAVDDARAFRWFLEAARQGVPAAQFFTGKAYELGRGVAHDDVRAYRWLLVAASQGQTGAAVSLENLATRMSPAQIAAARRQARALGSRLGLAPAARAYLDDASQPPLAGAPPAPRIPAVRTGAPPRAPAIAPMVVPARPTAPALGFVAPPRPRSPPPPRGARGTVLARREAPPAAASAVTRRPAPVPASTPRARVREAQRRLRALGYRVGVVDGRPGPDTRDAVRAFQRARGLRADGRIDARVLAALGLSAHPGAGCPRGPLSRERVRALQRALGAAGYRAGPPDGLLGPDTRRAIRAYRERAGLGAGDAIDAVLLRGLGLCARPPQ